MEEYIEIHNKKENPLQNQIAGDFLFTGFSFCARLAEMTLRY